MAETTRESVISSASDGLLTGSAEGYLNDPMMKLK